MDSLPMHMTDVDDFYVSEDEPPALQSVSDSESELDDVADLLSVASENEDVNGPGETDNEFDELLDCMGMTDSDLETSMPCAADDEMPELMDLSDSEDEQMSDVREEDQDDGCEGSTSNTKTQEEILDEMLDAMFEAAKELDLDLGFDEAARDALEFPWIYAIEFLEDPDLRFNVTPWDKDESIYKISDLDRGKYTLIEKSDLLNAHFNLERCMHLNMFPMKRWSLPEPYEIEVSSNDAFDSDEEVAQELLGDSPEFEFSSGDEVDIDKCPLIQKMGVLNGELSDIIVRTLQTGMPYPGDAKTRAPEHFSVGKSEKDDFYMILDNERDEAAYLHVSCLRNPSFNLGLWYAMILAERSNPESANTVVARWQIGQMPEETIIGRYFESRIELALKHGDPYGNKGLTVWPESCFRFLVDRDPLDANYLIVTDRRLQKMYPLLSSKAEGVNFDVCAWFCGVVESEILMKILEEEVDSPVPVWVEPSPAVTFAKAAEDENTWNRALPLASSLFRTSFHAGRAGAL
ncbi:hypothetical protein BKA70DRAFT_1232229 [Coprinopsis sp. MPI-PUGE-AT-0042]|nr:hypothetical protein BKA70DRAFT_1232229 [Coprinopsis sp. MPI-PUGE-AT-0042]